MLVQNTEQTFHINIHVVGIQKARISFGGDKSHESHDGPLSDVTR